MLLPEHTNSYTNMNRRTNGNLKVIAVVAVAGLFLYGLYSYHDLHTRFNKSEEKADRLRQQHDSISAQLQVVYEHKSRLENTLQQEKQSHSQTKRDLTDEKQKADTKFYSEKQELLARINVINSEHKMVQGQHEDLENEFGKQQSQFHQLEEDHKKMTEKALEEYMQLKQEKENAMARLLDELADLKRRHTDLESKYNNALQQVQYQQQQQLVDKQNIAQLRELLAQTQEQTELHTKLKQQLQQQLTQTQEQLVLAKQELIHSQQQNQQLRANLMGKPDNTPQPQKRENIERQPVSNMADNPAPESKKHAAPNDTQVQEKMPQDPKQREEQNAQLDIPLAKKDPIVQQADQKLITGEKAIPGQAGNNAIPQIPQKPQLPAFQPLPGNQPNAAFNQQPIVNMHQAGANIQFQPQVLPGQNFQLNKPLPQKPVPQRPDSGNIMQLQGPGGDPNAYFKPKSAVQDHDVQVNKEHLDGQGQGQGQDEEHKDVQLQQVVPPNVNENKDNGGDSEVKRGDDLEHRNFMMKEEGDDSRGHPNPLRGAALLDMHKGLDQGQGHGQGQGVLNRVRKDTDDDWRNLKENPSRNREVIDHGGLDNNRPGRPVYRRNNVNNVNMDGIVEDDNKNPVLARDGRFGRNNFFKQQEAKEEADRKLGQIMGPEVKNDADQHIEAPAADDHEDGQAPGQMHRPDLVQPLQPQAHDDDLHLPPHHDNGNDNDHNNNNGVADDQQDDKGHDVDNNKEQGPDEAYEDDENNNNNKYLNDSDNLYNHNDNDENNNYRKNNRQQQQDRHRQQQRQRHHPNDYAGDGL